MSLSVQLRGNAFWYVHVCFLLVLSKLNELVVDNSIIDFLRNFDYGKLDQVNLTHVKTTKEALRAFRIVASPNSALSVVVVPPL